MEFLEGSVECLEVTEMVAHAGFEFHVFAPFVPCIHEKYFFTGRSCGVAVGVVILECKTALFFKDVGVVVCRAERIDMRMTRPREIPCIGIE